MVVVELVGLALQPRLLVPDAVDEVAAERSHLDQGGGASQEVTDAPALNDLGDDVGLVLVGATQVVGVLAPAQVEPLPGGLDLPGRLRLPDLELVDVEFELCLLLLVLRDHVAGVLEHLLQAVA